MTGMRPAKFLVFLLLSCLVSMAVTAAQPVITGVSIPDVSMKINDVVTATIFVQSDSATVYTLNASNIGGYVLGSLSKQNSTTYMATFTILEGGTDYAAGDDIPTSVTLADGTLTDTWNTAISQADDPIDANRPLKPATPDLADASDNGHLDDDNVTNDNTPTFQGAAGSAEGNSTITVFSSIDGQLGTTVANADGSWSFTVSSSLADGTHNITVTATDAAGNDSDASDPLSVLIDTQDPGVPGSRSPADGTFTNDPSPTFSWSEPNDPGGSGISNYRIRITGPATRNYYTTNTAYTPSLGVNGTYTWQLYAIDIAGNRGPWSDAWEFTIDTVNPTVAAVTPSPGTIAEADVGTNKFSLTVDYSEPMDTGVAPSISFPVEDPSATITFNHGTWTDADTYVAYYDVADADQELADIDVRVSGGQDLAGNVQDSAALPDLFSIDTLPPKIVSITSSTPNGYYNVGDAINVTVNFSEPVTLSGGTLQVDLDSGSTVNIAPFGPVDSASTVYTVGAGENSCDLDVTNITLNGGTLRDAAGNDAVITLPATKIADGSDIVVDTAPPVIAPAASSETVECDGAGNSAELNSWLNSNSGASATDNCSAVTWTNDFTTLSDGCGETGSALVTFTATDACGNSSTTSATFTIEDTTAPTLSWTTPLPASPQYVDADCSVTIPIDATVSDACCISMADVVKTIPVIPNATITDTVMVTQVDANHVRVAGSITVSALNECPAVLTLTIQATDCCGNANTWTASVDIYDHTIPVISNLVVADHVPVSPDCCDTVVPFAAEVTDACCITPAGIAITAMNPTDNATISFDRTQDVVFTQIAQGHVGIAGVVHVRCLTSCPARVEVRIEATDRCGNAALPVTSTTTEGRVYDVTPPTVVDDPNGAGDLSAVLDPNMDVRLDDYGQYRLMVRQDTPVRIDVLANDTDNCSACTCCGTLWIKDIVQQPQYGALKIETDRGDCHGGTVIRYAPDRGYIGPDRFTYNIKDACGNVSATATVYLEVVAQTEMDDVYLTTCNGAPVNFRVRATDLWINPVNPAEIAFSFSVDSPMMHGIILGDLNDVTCPPEGRTTKQIESATINLTYVPAEGFSGRDTASISFADPFGGQSTAVVDILTSRCNEAPAKVIQLRRGKLLPIVVPTTFAAAYEGGEIAWTVEGTDGAPRAGVVSAKKGEQGGAYVLTLDTTKLPPGEYRVIIPLGSGERVIFTVEVSG